MNKRGQIIQLLPPIQKFFLLQRPDTIHAERSRESPFLLDQGWEEKWRLYAQGAKAVVKVEKI